MDPVITHPQEYPFRLPRSHPNRLTFIYGLAIARLRQYMQSNEREDLDQAISHLTESILFPPQSWLEHGPKILQALFLLALALHKRSRVYELPEDAVYAVEYLRHLRVQPHQAFGYPCQQVTGLLVDALAIQVESKAGNVIEIIGEMAVLCRERLALEVSNVHTIRSFTLFYTVLLPNFRLVVLEQQPLDQIIECLRVATGNQLDRLEERRGVTLASFLSARYSLTLVNDDYEEAASIWDEIISSGAPGDKWVALAQQNVIPLAFARSVAHGIPEYSEEAIYRARAFLGSSSATEQHRLNAIVNYSLERITKLRLEFFGPSEGLEPSSRIPSSSQLVPVVPIEDHYPELVWVRKEGELIVGLLKGIPNDDITKIDEAIQKGRNIVASSTPTDSLTASPSIRFGEVLYEAFQRTIKIEYLNESISLRRQVLKLPLLGPALRIRILHDLSLSLFTRSRFFLDHHTQDLDEALELLSQCANDKHGYLPARCWFACKWASVARLTQHPTISMAYESTLSLMQDTPLFAPTLQLQHTTLTMSDDYHNMPLDYVSYQVDRGQLEEAIVALERGRALLWSEMRHLRASIDQIRQADPDLGRKYAAVNQDFEELTKSIPPNHKLTMDGGPADAVRAVDPFGRLLLKQRQLLKERDNLVSQIQALPGFASFLASPSFDTLRSAASSGPVIIINHSSWRSDILILLYNSPPSLIPTNEDFFIRASALKNKLSDARNKHRPDSDDYNHTLAHVLTELYDLVGKPVIERLRQLNVPEQSRVWWCPTSVSCSLPLHAMGPIPSDDGEERYFLDIYVPSYTPTLSALISASDHHDLGPSISCPPSLLLVAHFDVPSPDVSLSEVCEDVKVVQALKKRIPVKSLISESAIPTSVVDDLRDTNLSTSYATARWRPENHLTPDSNFTETSA